MKKKLIIAVIWILLIGLLLSAMPWSRSVSVQTVVYEYALDQEASLQTHAVTIEGRYYPSLWREPYFDGTFAVSGFPFSLEESVRISFQRDSGGLGMLSYRDWAGQPRSMELNQIRMKDDFSEFVVMIFEIEEKDGRQYSRWDPESGHILCTNAPDYAALRTQCEALNCYFWEGEWE